MEHCVHSQNTVAMYWKERGQELPLVGVPKVVEKLAGIAEIHDCVLAENAHFQVADIHSKNLKQAGIPTA